MSRVTEWHLVNFFGDLLKSFIPDGAISALDAIVGTAVHTATFGLSVFCFHGQLLKRNRYVNAGFVFAVDDMHLSFSFGQTPFAVVAFGIRF